jgi:hypothetical protein
VASERCTCDQVRARRSRPPLSFPEAILGVKAAESLIDSANQYQLWVLPEGERIPVGYEKRLVASP